MSIKTKQLTTKATKTKQVGRQGRDRLRLAFVDLLI